MHCIVPHPLGQKTFSGDLCVSVHPVCITAPQNLSLVTSDPSQRSPIVSLQWAVITCLAVPRGGVGVRGTGNRERGGVRGRLHAFWMGTRRLWLMTFLLCELSAKLSEGQLTPIVYLTPPLQRRPWLYHSLVPYITFGASHRPLNEYNIVCIWRLHLILALWLFSCSGRHLFTVLLRAWNAQENLLDDRQDSLQNHKR